MRLYNHVIRRLRAVPVLRHLLSRRDLRRRYPVELALLDGRLGNRPDHPRSVIHFSLNKAATQYVKTLLFTCARHSNLLPVSMHDLAFESRLPYLTDGTEAARSLHRVFHPRGYVYSVFGGVIRGRPSACKLRTVIVIRDPRDILVSHYFSVAYSHAIPSAASNKRETIVESRAAALATDIDTHVVKEAPTLLARYTDMLNYCRDHDEDCMVFRYEEMISDFDTWLRSLIDFCQFSVCEETVSNLVSDAQARRGKDEDVRSHNRRGVHGDYANKLKPETISYLNETFEQVLEFFEY